MKKIYLFLTTFFCLSLSVYSQADSSVHNDSFISETKQLIKKKSKLWGKAVIEKDASYLKSIYDENATYLPDNADAIYGLKEIGEYWKASFDFIGDIKLQMKTLKGTKELLYETGIVSVNVMNQKGRFEEVRYKYVNVWKLQKDGDYKVVIDTFNDLPNE